MSWVRGVGVVLELASAKNKVEKSFVKVCQGKAAAESEIEKTWLAYLGAVKQVTSTMYTSYWHDVDDSTTEHID